MAALTPVTLVISEDPLLLQEYCAAYLAKAKDAGVAQRDIVEASEKTPWAEISANQNSLSLFAEVKLTDLRFSGLPGKEAQSALVELAAQANTENLLLVRLPKLDKKHKSSKWFKSLSAGAQIEELWPPRTHEYPRWLEQRALGKGVQLDTAALQLLAEQTEGNLLAADQLLQKLQLLFPEQRVDADRLSGLIADNAKYSLFLCLDEALAAKGDRAVRMLHKFQQEGVAPISILVNLTREVELCLKVSTALAIGETPTHALAKTFLWEAKKKLIIAASKRLPLAIWQRLLVRCAYLDRLVKGQETGDIWQELELCLWMVSGQKVWGKAR